MFIIDCASPRPQSGHPARNLGFINPVFIAEPFFQAFLLDKRKVDCVTNKKDRHPHGYRQGFQEYGLSEEQLWTHSVASAVIADGIRDFTERQIPVEVTTAALLHDVGKLVLARHLDASLLQYLHNARGDGGLSEQRAEMEILGVNHAELGCLIAQHWNLPEIICRGIGYHHAPGDYFGDDRETLVAHGVHLANRVATFVCGEDSEMPEADAMLAASKIRLETMCNEMRDNFIEISGMYG